MLFPAAPEGAGFASGEDGETVANIGSKDWATSKTVDELIEALEFAVGLLEKKHDASADDKIDGATLSPSGDLKPDPARQFA